VLVCKLLEFCALMLMLALSLLGPFSSFAAEFRGPLKVAAGVCIGLVVGVVLLAHNAQRLAAWLDGRHRGPRARAFLHEVGEGLGTARSFRGMGVALVYSALPVLASATAYGLALEASGVPGGRFAGPVVLGAIALGQSAVGIPADTGIYYFLTSWTARKLGASADAAAAYAVLTHLATVVTQMTVGAISLWIRKIRWQDLRRRRDMAAEALREVEVPIPPRVRVAP
jgi:hypothetical protein